MDALGDGEALCLLEVAFHTALALASSSSHITHLLKNIRFKRYVVKGSHKAEVHSSLHPTVLAQRVLADRLCFVCLLLCRSLFLFLLVPWAEK